MLGFKSTYVTGPISLVFAITYMASKEWDRIRYGRIRATRFTDRGPISLVKHKPPPEDLMESGTFRRWHALFHHWLTSQPDAGLDVPPPHRLSISPRSNSDLATLYCPRATYYTTSLDEGMFKIQKKLYGRRWGRILDRVGWWGRTLSWVGVDTSFI